MPTESQTTPKLEAKVRLYHDVHGRAELLGFADLSIAESFVIKGIRIVVSKEEGSGGDPFISFPSRKGSEAGKYFDIAHPISSEAHQRAKETIMEAYKEAVARAAS